MKRAKSCCSQQSIFQLDDSRVSFSLFIDDEKVLHQNYETFFFDCFETFMCTLHVDDFHPVSVSRSFNVIEFTPVQ